MSFGELQKTKIQIFVEEILAPHFCVLIQFVNECEPLVEQNNTQSLAKYSSKLTQIIRAFAAGMLYSVKEEINEII